jgi:CrcB protein
VRFLWVGLAGAIGTVLRYSIDLRVDQERFPWATLAINVSGAFVLALFLTLALGRVPISVMTPVAVGLLGGYTTFSTFAWRATP